MFAALQIWVRNCKLRIVLPTAAGVAFAADKNFWPAGDTDSEIWLNWKEGLRGRFFFRISQLESVLTRRRLTLLVHAGLFCCFHSPSNSDMDYMILNVCMALFLPAYTHRAGDLGRFVVSLIPAKTWVTFVVSAQNLRHLTLGKSQGGGKA